MTLDEMEKLVTRLFVSNGMQMLSEDRLCTVISRDLRDLLFSLQAVLPVVKAAASLVDSWDGPVAMKAGVSYDDEIARARALIAAIDAIRGGVT